MANHKVTVELKSIGIMDEDLILELPFKVVLSIHLNPLDQLCVLEEVYIEAGPEINQEALKETIKRKWNEDLQFRRRAIYRARYESTPTRTEEAGLEAMTPSMICSRLDCTDRRWLNVDPMSAHQDTAGPLAERKVG